MKRRSFIKALVALVALPFAPKVAQRPAYTGPTALGEMRGMRPFILGTTPQEPQKLAGYKTWGWKPDGADKKNA